MYIANSKITLLLITDRATENFNTTDQNFRNATMHIANSKITLLLITDRAKGNFNATDQSFCNSTMHIANSKITLLLITDRATENFNTTDERMIFKKKRSVFSKDFPRQNITLMTFNTSAEYWKVNDCFFSIIFLNICFNYDNQIARASIFVGF